MTDQLPDWARQIVLRHGKNAQEIQAVMAIAGDDLERVLRRHTKEPRGFATSQKTAVPIEPDQAIPLGRVVESLLKIQKGPRFGFWLRSVAKQLGMEKDCWPEIEGLLVQLASIGLLKRSVYLVNNADDETYDLDGVDRLAWLIGADQVIHPETGDPVPSSEVVTTWVTTNEWDAREGDLKDLIFEATGQHLD